MIYKHTSSCIIGHTSFGFGIEKNKDMLPISSNSVVDEGVPLLQSGHGGGGGGARWWNKVFSLDMVEAKRQVLFALPMILTNVFYYCIALVSVMFAGHLGELELAGATLANSWATVTGFALMIGLSGALETLCGQGFGSKTYGLLGIYLQASCIISIIFAIFISIFWFFTEPILILLHQEPAIAETAALYMKYLIPGIFAFGFLQNMLRFLQTQSVVIPTIVFSGVPLVIHVGGVYALVHWTSLGFRGAPLAVSLSLCFSTIMLALYVMFSKKFEQTWEGFSFESFYHVISNLKLALPSAAMVCLEYWSFEILVILAGLMANAETSTSMIAMCVNTEAIAYMLTYGLSAAASTRVSNELGANNPERAKNAMKMSLNHSVLLSLCFVLALGLGHNVWAGLFSDSPTIISEFASMTPLLVVSIVIDSIQGVLSGVARGCGWQNVVAVVNLGTFYFIGMPIAVLLGFKFGLHTKGLWIGVICGLSCQAVCLLVVTFRSNWTKMELPAKENEENIH